MEILFGILLVFLLIAGWLIVTYNSLVRSRVRTEEGWSDIEVQMKRRYDLIPNLVNTVKAYAKHEASVFENVTKARAEAMGAQTMEEHAKSENALTDTLKSLFAVAENYPTLQATQNFLHLQKELADAEDKIQAARRFYNSMARDFNTKVQTFPNNLIAGMFSFHKKDFFDAPDEVEKVPEVNL